VIYLIDNGYSIQIETDHEKAAWRLQHSVNYDGVARKMYMIKEADEPQIFVPKKLECSECHKEILGYCNAFVKHEGGTYSHRKHLDSDGNKPIVCYTCADEPPEW
jgi:hypothetical protein